MDIFKSKIQKLILPKFRSVYVTDYFERIESMMKGRPDLSCHRLLANPRLRTRTEITWASDCFSSAPRSLASLSGEEREKYTALLRQNLNEIVGLIETLREEEGDEMADLLSRTLDYIDEENVMCGDNHVVLVNWGVLPRNPKLDQGAIIARNAKLQGAWAISPAAPVPDIPKQGPADPGEPMEPLRETEPVVPETETPRTPEIREEIRPEIPAESRTAVADIVPEPVQPLNPEVSKPKESPEGPLEDPVKPETPPTPPVEKKKEEVQSPNPKPRKSLVRKIWPWLAGLAAVVLFLFCVREYQGQPNQYNPFYRPLPSNPTIPPVYEGKVAPSADGMYTVCSDRFNVLFSDVNEDTFLDFALAFKKEYPSIDYKVVWYNDELKTMQIVCPPERRMALFEEIPAKLNLKGYDLFEEAVYQTTAVPTDPGLSDSDMSWYIDAIHAREAWAENTGSEEIIVAIVDNGFDLNHPEFEGKIVKPYNAVTNTAVVRPVITLRDETTLGPNPHGTHVAATAVGNADNGSGLSGIAPACQFMPVQVGYDNPQGHMSHAAILNGTLYAINNGADVVNISIGEKPTDELAAMSEAQQLNYIANSRRFEQAVWRGILEKAAEKGTIIVQSAGNYSVISGLDPRKRDELSILVSAIDPEIKKASFSNFGRYPELGLDYSNLSAPGVHIYNAAPEGKYVYLDGTSMATPIVTGAIALLKSVNPDITVAEARDILQRTGHEVNPKIGPLIDLSRAMKYAKGEPVDSCARPEPGDCAKVAKEIERLEKEIERLKRSCPGATEQDTLRFREAIEDPTNFNGLWKATTQLFASLDQSPIELFINVNDRQGQLLIVNKEKKFVAPLNINITDSKVNITQSQPARCPEEETYFLPYTYVCSEDRNGYLYCVAKCVENGQRVEFNLVRVKQ